MHAFRVLIHHASQPAALLPGTFGNSWGNFELSPHGGWDRVPHCRQLLMGVVATRMRPNGLRCAGRPTAKGPAGSGVHGALLNSLTSFDWSLVTWVQRSPTCGVPGLELKEDSAGVAGGLSSDLRACVEGALMCDPSPHPHVGSAFSTGQRLPPQSVAGSTRLFFAVPCAT